jgi:hypothetical protein
LWSEGPLTIGDVQEELNLVLSIKILSMAVLEEFRNHFAKFKVCDKLYVFSKEFTCFSGYFYLNSLCLRRLLFSVIKECIQSCKALYDKPYMRV